MLNFIVDALLILYNIKTKEADVSIFLIMMEPYYIVVPWPKEQSRLLAPIRPFQPPPI